MTRELERSILKLLVEHGRTTTDEIAESLPSDAASVSAALQQMKQNQWVVDIGNGHWRAVGPRLG